MTSCAKEVGKLIKDVGETTISSLQSHFLEKSNHLQVLQNYFSNAEKAFLADEEEEAQLWILAIQDAFQALKYTWLSINAMEENESKIASLLNQEATLYQGAEKNIAKAAEIYFRDDSYLILKNTRDRVVRAAELIEKAIEAIKSNEEKIANYYQQAAEYQVKDADALEEIREKWNLVSQYTSKIAEVMEKGLQVPPHLKQEAECYTQAANYYQQAAAYAFERTQQDVRNDKFRTAADYAAKAAETSIQKIRALQAKKEEAANYYQEAANFQIQAAEAISKENFWSLSLFHDTSESILNAAINSLEKKEEATFYYNKSKEYHLKALELWESNWWVAARHVYDAAELAKKGFDLEEKIANASKNGKMDIAHLFLQARNYNQLAIQYKIRLAELEEKSKNFLFNDHFDIGIVWKNASDHASEACKFIENIGQLSFFIENQKEIESNKTQQYFPNHLTKEHLCFLEDKTTSEESRGVNLFFNSIINSYQSAFNYLVHSIKSFDQGNDKETVNNYQASERIFSQIELFKWIAMRPNAEEVTYKKMAMNLSAN